MLRVLIHLIKKKLYPFNLSICDPNKNICLKKSKNNTDCPKDTEYDDLFLNSIHEFVLRFNNAVHHVTKEYHANRKDRSTGAADQQTEQRSTYFEFSCISKLKEKCCPRRPY